MKLTDISDMTFKQVLEQCDIMEQKIHSSNVGEIYAIEVKYVPKDEVSKIISKMNDGRSNSGISKGLR